MRMAIWFISALLFVGLVACLPLARPKSPLPTPTLPPPTVTPTSTIVWFPPTATFTPLPTPTFSITPTVDTQPSFGAVIFEENFDNPENWSLGNFAVGSIALGQNELTISISQKRGYLFSLLNSVLMKDFYIQVDANPSICRGVDEYGLLLRVSPALDFFRFSLTCDGYARVDRYYNGQASSPVPLTCSSAIPRGAPSVSRLAVWASGREMRFYVNQVYLFTLSDPTLPSGTLGVFARAAGEDLVTVNFSNLKVFEVRQ